MDDQTAGLLVVELAGLAGRSIDDHEVAAVIALSREMTAQEANNVWYRHRSAPATVPLRDYLAMTLRFIDRAPPPDRST